MYLDFIETHKNCLNFKRQTNPLGGEYFTFWEGEFRKNSSSKYLTLVCEKCLSDPEVPVIYFKTEQGELNRKRLPCGCATNRTANLLRVGGEDPWVGKTFETSTGGIVTTTGTTVYYDNKGKPFKKYRVYCEVCDKDTEMFPNGIQQTLSKLKNKNSGCLCSKSFKKSKEQYEVCFSRNENFEVLERKDKYLSTTKIDSLCKGCNSIQQKSAGNLANGTARCGNCSKKGYNISAPTYFYLQKVGQTFGKFGKTNRLPSDRLKQQKEKNKKYSQTLILDFYSQDGILASKLEYLLKKTINSGVIPKEEFPDGYTETFNIEDLGQVLDKIKEVYIE